MRNINIKNYIGNNIIIDVIDSWPEEVISTIRNYHQLIDSYFVEKNRIRLMHKEDWTLRYNSPQNSYKMLIEELYKEINLMLEKYTFIGFHCSRLLEHEIDDISKVGLKSLNSDFMSSKITNLRYRKIISDDECNYLLENNHSKDEYRMDRVCTFSCIKILKDRSGLERLFNFWGGEAIFVGKEKELDIKRNVLTLGKSVIVLGIIKYDDVPYYNNLAEKFINYYYQIDRDDSYLYEYELELHTNRTIEVVSIITFDDPIFDKLTNYNSW